MLILLDLNIQLVCFKSALFLSLHQESRDVCRVSRMGTSFSSVEVTRYLSQDLFFQLGWKGIFLLSILDRLVLLYPIAMLFGK